MAPVSTVLSVLASARLITDPELLTVCARLFPTSVAAAVNEVAESTPLMVLPSTVTRLATSAAVFWNSKATAFCAVVPVPAINAIGS